VGARFLKDGRFFSRDTAFRRQNDSGQDKDGLCVVVLSFDQSTRPG